SGGSKPPRCIDRRIRNTQGGSAMGMDERRIWKIVGEPATSVLAEVEAQRKAWNQALEDFKRKHNADSCWGGDGHVFGITVESKAAPAPWKPEKDNPTWFRPDRRTKAGKALAEELRRLNAIYDRRSAAYRFFDRDADATVCTGSRMYFPSF